MSLESNATAVSIAYGTCQEYRNLTKSDDLPDNLRIKLRNNGFPSSTFFDERSLLLQQIEHISFAFVLIECGEGGGRGAEQLAKVLDYP